MKIFDCVTFFEENRYMDLRFNILNRVIDKFVICEGKYDHRGNEKKINFNKKNFPIFEDKIIHIICEKFPDNLNPWERQAYQREKLFNGIKEADENDLILFSDPDEIPNPKKIESFKSNEKYTIFMQKMFYYKINLKVSLDMFDWEGTRGCLKKNLKSFDYMRHKVLKKNLKYKFWRFDKEKDIKIIEDGGWHFSYLLTPEEIQKKIKTFAHTEFDKDEFTNIENINKSIEMRVDLFDKSKKFQKIELDDTFPKYILENKKKLSEWIIY